MVTTPARAQLFPVVYVDDEARIGHFDLADRLGHGDRRDVSRLIQRSRQELGRYGSIGQRAQMVRIGSGARRSVNEYLLNEPQSLLVCIFAQTTRAADVRQILIETFLSVRHEQRRKSRAIVVAPREGVSALKITSRKRAFASAVASLMDIGIDYRDFDQERVIEFAGRLLNVSEAF